eukprot:139785_1
MSATHSTNTWIHLTECPSLVKIPTGLDINNYIAINYSFHNSKINCIYKYNTDTDKWSKIDGCNDIQNIPQFTAALDTKKQMLFLSHNLNITQIQLNNGNIETIQTNSPNTTTCINDPTIVINNSLFMIGGYQNYSILKLDSESKSWVEFSDHGGEIEEIHDFAMTYNHKNNCILLFGGFDWDCEEYVDFILEFNLQTKQWNKLPVALPRKMDSMCCTMAINNKYVLLFGGKDDGGYYCNNIYIYSIKNKTIKESKIRCPSKGLFSCVTVNDNIKDEKIVFGYVRNQWKTYNINDNYFP